MQAMVVSVSLALVGCSSMEVARTPATAEIPKHQYRVYVHTGDGTMDQIVWNQASMQLGKVLNVVDAAGSGQAGAVEITFTSTSQNAFIGSSSATATTYSSGQGWYSGTATRYGNTTTLNGQIQTAGTSTTYATGTSTVMPLTWQNSTMFVTVKAPDGSRLWQTQYHYKGGWELSGWSVNTADEAANLCLKRISRKLKADLKK